MTAGTSVEEVDLSLLRGFRFTCRPDCGLCCYAEPLVTPAERPALLRIQPPAELTAHGKFEFLRGRHPGGACGLLVSRRCRGHDARPAPCREYPIVAHLGPRVQASVILTCPGVDLSLLRGYRGPEAAARAEGFSEEVAALKRRWALRSRPLLQENAKQRNRLRRKLERVGRWEEEGTVREELRRGLPSPSRDDFPVDGPPEQEEGLELLPLFWDGRDGPVAVSTEASGWELAELSPDGGVRQSVGTAPPPSQPPALTEEAEVVLRGYLRYWLERDQLFSIVHRQLFDDPRETVGGRVRFELRGIGAQLLTTAAVLASALRGNAGALSEADLLLGIRAVDQDLLDRPSWGAPF